MQGGQKYWHIFVRLTDYRNYFMFRIKRKFVIILSIKIPPHFMCVATLPCEMSQSGGTQSHCFIDRAIGQWCLQLDVQQQGGHIDVKTAGCDSYFRQ